MATTTAMATLKKEAVAAFTNALTVGRDYADQLATSDEFMRPVVMACGISAMRSALSDDAMAVVRPLAGTELGFKTDRDYDNSVLKDCLICAVLNGVNVVNNEFNIISGGFYIAKNGWTRKLREHGFTRIDPQIGRIEDVREGSPNEKGNRQVTGLLACSASCVKGKETFQVTAVNSDSGDCRIEVSAFGKSLADVTAGLKGKAEARILRKLWFFVAGEPDIESDEPDSILPSVIVVNEKAEEQPKQIEAPAEPAAAATAQPETWSKEWQAYKAVPDIPKQERDTVIEIANRMRAATGADAVHGLLSEAESLRAGEVISQRSYDKVKLYFGFRLQQLQG